MNPLRDIFLYFAKFPKKGGVLELFNQDESEFYPDYAPQKAEIEALETHSLVPALKEFVFGVNEDSEKKRILLTDQVKKLNLEGLNYLLEYNKH